MRELDKKVRIAVLLIFLPGYALLAAAKNLVGMESITVSLVMMLEYIVSSVAPIAQGYRYWRGTLSSGRVFCFYFLIMCLFVFYIDIIYIVIYLSRNPCFYRLWTFSGSVLVMLVLVLKPFGSNPADWCFKRRFQGTFIAGGIAVYTAISPGTARALRRCTAATLPDAIPQHRVEHAMRVVVGHMLLRVERQNIGRDEKFSLVGDRQAHGQFGHHILTRWFRAGKSHVENLSGCFGGFELGKALA